MLLFVPEDGKTVNISVAASSSNVQVTSDTVRRQISVVNTGTATVWIKFGLANTVAAVAANDIPIAAGSTRGFTIPEGPIWVAAIAAGATGSIYFTPGNGI